MSTKLEREGRAALAAEDLLVEGEPVPPRDQPTSLLGQLLRGQAEHHRGRAEEFEVLAKMADRGNMSGFELHAIRQLVYREMRREGR